MTRCLQPATSNGGGISKNSPRISIDGSSLAAVLAHYNRAPAAPSGHSELKPLRLNGSELRQLESFVRTLTGAPASRPYQPAPHGGSTQR